jgi:purine-binding chemotaxis protein CheW
MKTVGMNHHILLVRTHSWSCALQMSDIVETMRTLPVVPFAVGPRFLRGVSVVRGAPLPVINLAVLLGAEDGARGRRFVVLRSGARRFCLEVDEVVGVPHIDLALLEKAPPLLSGVLTEHVERLGVLDGEVLVSLEPARLIPDEVWRSLEEQGGR